MTLVDQRFDQSCRLSKPRAIPVRFVVATRTSGRPFLVADRAATVVGEIKLPLHATPCVSCGNARCGPRNAPSNAATPAWPCDGAGPNCGGGGADRPGCASGESGAACCACACLA